MTDRCSLCPGVNMCIPAHGEGDILFIGEAPGIQEDKNARRHPPGTPFIGKTGEEVDRHYLPLAGLRRERVRFTNAIRCLPASTGGKLDPTLRKDLDLLACCAGTHLYPDIEQGRYKLIVPLGAFAVRALLPDVDLNYQHGIPCDSPWGIPAFPMYHPAQGIHEPKKMLLIRTDWHRLRSYLSGTLRLPTDDYPNPDYREVTDAEEFTALDPTQPLAADTEYDRHGDPFCLTYSTAPGTGRLIRAGREDLLAEFGRHLPHWRGPLLFHNWLADKPITESLGLRFPEHRIVDTMSRVFHLGNLPQGLKALAFRELGMVMDDFESLVSPYSTDQCLLYLRAAQTYDWPKPEEETVIDEVTGLWKLYKPQSMSTKLKRFFTDYSKNPEGKDIFKAWDNWETSQALIEATVGKEFPGLDIRHVPFPITLHYACRDSDATLRLYYVLQAMRRRVRRFSQELWRVA